MARKRERTRGLPQQQQQRRPEHLLQEAIDDVLQVVRRWLWLTLALGVVASLLAFAAVLNRMFIVVFVGLSHSHDTLQSAIIFLVVATVFAVAVRYIQDLSVITISGHVARRLAVPAVLATASRAGRPETLASGAIGDIETLRTSLAGPASTAAVHIVMVPLLILLIFVLHWAFALLALGFCAVAAVLSYMIARAGLRAAALHGAAQARGYGLAADAMRGGEAVLAMGMLPKLIRTWINASTETAGEAWRAERDTVRLRTALELLMALMRGALILFSAILMLNGENMTVVLVGVLFIVGRLTEPFILFGGQSHEIGEGLAAWGRLRALVDGSAMPPEGIAFPCPRGRLTVERLSFAFRGPAPAILRNIEMAVEPGEIVGIIGASGSGKSTLLRLLIGMYRPTTGGAYLDGHATYQWDRRDLARHVGFMPQEPLLSRGTAAEVIARLEEPDMPLVLDAAKRAGAHAAIIGLPQGYATPISGGFRLSMGQKQRISLARALYARPKLLVLDELAAAMDAEGEAHVARLLNVLREEGTAVIFTTHRPQLLATADRILALRGGTLITAGQPQTMRLGQRTGQLGQRQAA